MTEPIHLPFPGLSPKGERLISEAHRAHIRAFSEFVHAARAIADDIELSVEDRTGKLRELEASLDDPARDNADGSSERLRRSLQETGVSADYARHVLQACHKDVHASGYRSWSELLTYCRYAAAPAGRFVLALHNESEAAMKGTDGLFSAWRVLGALQHCGRDYRDHGRVYLPGTWMRECAIEPEALAGGSACPGLLAVVAKGADGARRLIDSARPGCAEIANPRLRRAAQMSLALAGRLADRLARRDPLARTVDVTRWDRMSVHLRSRR